MLAQRLLWVLGIVVFVCPWGARAQQGIGQINNAAIIAGPGYPFVLSTPGSYVLTGNLVAPGTHGIVVTADNVTIDLNGFSISGGGAGTGIEAGVHSGLTVRNGVVDGFSVGIATGSDCKLIDIKISNNNQGVIGAVRCLVTGNHIISNAAHGIEALNSRIEGNIIANNGGWGLSITAGSLLLRNRISNNALGGIVDNGGAKIQDNVISNNGAFGISDGAVPPPLVPPPAPPFPTGTRSSIVGNTIDHSAGPGISTMLPALIKDNTVTSSSATGIVCGAGCVVSGNTVDRNNLSGAPGAGGVSVAAGSNVSGNAISYNQGFGLTLPAGANASYTNNTITGNGTPLGAGPEVISPPTLTGGAGNNCGGVACP